MNKLSIVTLLLLSVCICKAQTVDMDSYLQRTTADRESLFSNYPVRNIGPTVQGGRVTDIVVPEGQITTYYVAYASGGIFKTTDNGITFKPIFDDQDALGIGDLALAPSNPDIIYAGTGEKNSSRSSYAGTGIYKSTDGGVSWKHLGLEQTHHIGRVIVHPSNPDIVWVAALGALYSNNADRGVYLTEDGGNTWNKTLFVNDSTGIVDLVINPANPDELLAAAWERTRKASDFKGDGPGSGIYRSTDGGKSWTLSKDGFPTGDGIGRIGLAVSASNPSRYYALLDNQNTKEGADQEESEEGLTFSDFTSMSVEDALKIDDKELAKFLKDNNFPEKYSAESVKRDLKEGKYTPVDIGNYYGDANNALFNTDVIGAEIYRSDDHGMSWQKVNSYELDGVYFTYGYYFGEIRVAPDNPDLVYVFGVPLLKSTDGGVKYNRIDTLGDVHVDHQTLWINPENSRHLRLGNDGGLYESFDEGANWRHINNMSVGQFYTVNVDYEKPYNVYGGLQDNGTLMGPSTSVPNRTPFWTAIYGGDGMFVAPDPRNSSIVYVGFQFGNYARINRETGESLRLRPRHDIGEDVPRFNWRTPVKLSEHNADVVYMASQRLYRSMNQGENWSPISPDLTKNLPQGNVPFSTITTFSESPLQFGFIYAGTDDGNVWVTRSAGGDWEKISSGLPQGKWVASVVASPHELSTVFVTLNGYREDDFNTYVYMSEDAGKTWINIGKNLPEMVVNDLIQDPVKPEILYLGGDLGMFVSMDSGNSWEYVSRIPNVAVYDLIVHPRDLELVVATHGRSMYVMDVKMLHQIAGKTDELHIAGSDQIRYSPRWGERRFEYVEPYEPELKWRIYTAQAGPATVTIADSEGQVLRNLEMDLNRGFNQFTWDLKVLESNGKKGKKEEAKEKYIGKGSYKVTVNQAGKSVATTFEVK
ncbi:VPS10 domain-containing protein [Fulvivirga sedimenti]|uniref:Glycosyl hydrolase n=1 Tax=Fulvivirga sedimenti TaxID=2879465 RepID=A0A9X1HU00_9BACT|nr:glycosyl hydrolase [Fulvivirga sedimenti]MCA6077916.1 glycosyl hydrolase [Fulvivirga sedimenti]